MTEWILHTVVVSYKRHDLTRQCVESFQDTVTIPYTIVVVDNGSPPETVKALRKLKVPLLELDQNYYPGFATNRGWERAPDSATLLQRSDNDTLYLPHWCDEMVEAFERNPKVMQYGPVAAGDEPFTAMSHWPVGGNSIIRRQIYDEGLRYTEVPWPELRVIEEQQLTHDVWGRGYERVFGTRPGIIYNDDGDLDYHRQSKRDRGIHVDW